MRKEEQSGERLVGGRSGVVRYVSACASRRLLHGVLLAAGFSALSCLPLRAQVGLNPFGSQQTAASGSDCTDPSQAALPDCQQATQQPSDAALPQTGLQQIQSTRSSTPGSFSDVDSARRETARTTPRPEEFPAPLTEFQRFAANSFGYVLPVYGASLFRDVPTTFAPVDHVPITPDFVIGPGDELLIRIWGQVNQNLRLTVDRAGLIYIPQVGSVRVAGLQFAQLDGFLRAQLGRVFRNFDLNVNLGQLRSIQVFVVGRARRPGSYTISALSTLVNALFASGGPSPEGSMRRIQLKRRGANGVQVVTELDLYALLLKGDSSKDVPLEPGDVIYIPECGPQVAIGGSVRNPGIVELLGPTTAQEALALAGGFSETAYQKQAYLERIDSHSALSATEVPLGDDAAAVELRGGDLLRVSSVVPKLQNSVTLRGNVANPGLYGWHPGMRVRDLIPDKESLLTRDYWARRNREGMPVIDYIPLTPEQEWRRTQREQPRDSLQPRNSMAGRNGMQGYADQTGEYDSRREMQGAAANTPVVAEERSDITSTAGMEDVLHTSEELRASAEAAQSASNPQQGRQNGESRPQSDVRQPTVDPLFLPRNTVKLPAPAIDWSYAVIERVDPQNLTTSLVPFNLGRSVLERDDSQNLELQPGDIVTIFSQADIHVPVAQQTRFVRLEGELMSPGVYSVKPGETLRDLVVRAGGLAPQAYLYGSIFTRESTRQQQQLRLDQYVGELAHEVDVFAANKANTVVSAQEAAAAPASIQSQRQLVERLQQVRATGRIVLGIEPQMTTLEAIPAIPLEDGDRFYIPPAPLSINVVGAVYNQDSFLWRSNSQVGDYLKMSGGPNRNGDRKHIFLIRANGSVDSKSANSGLFKSFDSLAMNPGDTLVIPDDLNKKTILRGLTDWSLVFSQFALGAAAVNVIR